MIEAELPDGTILEFPEGTSPDVMRAAVQRMGKPKQPSFGEMFKQEVMGSVPVQTGLGALRGAAGIGNTLLRAAGLGNRQEGIEGGMQALGADPSSMAYGAGKIGAEIAGTAGIGGAIAKPVGAVLGRVAPSAAPAVVQALRTGGMSTGGGLPRAADIALRTGAGAAVGGASAAAVNPEDAGLGAAIGAAMPGAGQLLSAGGRAAKSALGMSTGVGDEAITQAFQAGKAGGQKAQSFVQNLRGNSSMDDVLGAARANIDEMGRQRSAAYRAGMANIKADKSVLDMSNIGKSVDDALGMTLYKGQIKDENAARVMQQIKGEIDNWRSLDPAEFHTPEGLDALKQKIGGLLEAIPFEQKTARTAAGGVYNAVKAEIQKQAPEYSKVMREYSDASELVREIERSLSLGQKASADTAMRKLQSLMRNNVNTSYGYRTDLARQLEQAGGQELMPALAGQALRDWTPRGIQRAAVGTGGVSLAALGEPVSGAALALSSSPRLVGEAAYGAGRLSGANPALVQALRQAAYRGAPIIGAQ